MRRLAVGVGALGCSGALAWLLFGALLDLESTSRQWDAHTQLQVIRRIVDIGGPYYVTGSDQKGPLWLAHYEAAYRLFGEYYVWFGVAALIIVIAAATTIMLWGIGVIAAREDDHSDRLLGGPALAAAGVALAGLLVLVLGDEEWARVLYSRNVVGMLLAGALLALAATRITGATGRRVLPAIAGVFAGLAVQTNPSSVFSAGVLAALAAWLGWPRQAIAQGAAKRLPTPLVLYASAAAVALFSAHAYYLARGSFTEFWDQWWTYNRFYAEATDRSLSGWLTATWDGFSSYYWERWWYALIVMAFAVSAFWRRRAGRATWLDATILAWFGAELLAVAVAQRFFPHYFVLLFLPVLAMALVMTARVARRSPWAIGAVSAVAVAVVLLGPANSRVTSAMSLAAGFDGAHRHILRDISYLAPDRQQLREQVRRFSSRDDYIVSWSVQPSVYTDVERRSAARFIESRWMIGRIYGSPDLDGDPRWILPATYDKWASDVRQNPPRLWIEFSEEPVPSESPYAAFRRCAFEKVWEGPTATGATQILYQRRRPVERCLPTHVAPRWNGRSS